MEIIQITGDINIIDNNSRNQQRKLLFERLIK